VFYTIKISYSNSNNYSINLDIMNALLFPGQGSQVVGMGSEFYKEFDIVKNISKRPTKIKLSISK